MSNSITQNQEVESLRVQKGILTQSKIANVQLAALNLTNADIAASNRRIESIQRDTLDEAKRQTAVLELQLEETKLAKLERTRQQQLKQAAFSLNKELDVLSGYRIFSRLILIKKINTDLNEVGLSAEELHEITDKEYTHTILKKLVELTARTENEMSEVEKMKVTNFQAGLNDLLILTRRTSAIQNETIQTEARADGKKRILTSKVSKKAGYKTVLIVFGATLLTAVLSAFLSGIFNSNSSSIEFVGCILLFVALFICPIWLLSLFFYNAKEKVKNKLNQPQIQQIKDEIKSLEEKIKNLVGQKADLQSKLDARLKMLSKTITEYPELKDLALMVSAPPIISRMLKNSFLI